MKVYNWAGGRPRQTELEEGTSVGQLQTVRKVAARAGRNGKSLDVDQVVYERQAMICKAFANPTRIHLLDLLGGGERTLTELQTELGVTKANLSQHLSVLRLAGVVVTRRAGKQVISRLAMPEIKQACQLIRNVLRAQVRETRHLGD